MVHLPRLPFGPSLGLLLKKRKNCAALRCSNAPILGRFQFCGSLKAPVPALSTSNVEWTSKVEPHYPWITRHMDACGSSNDSSAQADSSSSINEVPYAHVSTSNFKLKKFRVQGST